jgi:hypothetical protein
MALSTPYNEATGQADARWLGLDGANALRSGNRTMLIEPEIEDFSIVLVGDFNPPIFTPDWFLRNGIIGPEAAADAKIDLIHPEFSQLEIANCKLVVERNKFTISTQAAPSVKILDVTTKAFAEALPHTPIRFFGVNRSVHFSVGKESIRTSIGRMLAPTACWGEWKADIEKGEGLEASGMLSLSMMAVQVEPPFRRKTTATVQPSAQLRDPLIGIFMLVNDHFEPRDAKPESEAVLIKLSEVFDHSIRHSEWIIDQIMKLKKKANA